MSYHRGVQKYQVWPVAQTVKPAAIIRVGMIVHFIHLHLASRILLTHSILPISLLLSTHPPSLSPPLILPPFHPPSHPFLPPSSFPPSPTTLPSSLPTLHPSHGWPACSSHSQITLHIHRLAVHQIELQMAPQNVQQVLYDVCTVVKETLIQVFGYNCPQALPTFKR